MALTKITGEGVGAVDSLSVDGSTIKLDGNYPVGTGNVALGDTALSSGSLSGGNNTAIGDQALYSNTSGAQVTGVGALSLANNSTGIDNTGLGYASLVSNTTGNYNTALGRSALNSSTTASNNTAVGKGSGQSLTTGAGNTFLGVSAGGAITTGSKNVVLGQYNGNQNGLDIRTGNNNIVLSDGDGNPRLIINSNGDALFNGSQYVLGINSGTYNWYMGTTNNRLEAYDGSGTLRGYLTLAGAWTDTSDTAFKRDISDMTYGITTVKALQPRVYHVAGTTGTDDPQIGFVAQEIESHVPEVVTGEDGSKGVSYGRLTAVLTKALQEAIDKIETLETKVAALEGAN